MNSNETPARKPETVKTSNLRPASAALYAKYGLNYEGYLDGFSIASAQQSKNGDQLLIYLLFAGAVFSALLAVMFTRLAALLVAACAAGIIKLENKKKNRFKISDQKTVVMADKIISEIGERRYEVAKEEIRGLEVQTTRMNDKYTGTVLAVKENGQFPVLRLFGAEEGELKKDIFVFLDTFKQMGYNYDEKRA